MTTARWQTENWKLETAKLAQRWQTGNLASG
jgi:hypothetical protein